VHSRRRSRGALLIELPLRPLARRRPSPAGAPSPCLADCLSGRAVLGLPGRGFR
jgi:hypothetical protein